MKLNLLLVLACLLCIIGSCKKSGKNDPQPTPPGIADFTPKSANVGETVTITGQGFGNDINAVSVRFGGSVTTKPSAVSGSSLTVNVPADAKTGAIEVAVGGQTATSSAIFTLTDPTTPKHTIATFTPETAKVGATITVTGTGFGTNKDVINVKIGASANIHPDAVSATSMTVTIPADATTGKIQIAVNGSAYLSSSKDFTLKPTLLAITEFSPKTVTIGDKLTIKGVFGDKADQILVYFKTSGTSLVQAKPTTYSATQLEVVIPATSVTGTIRAVNNTLDFSESVFDTKDILTILPITVVSQVSPTSARAGEIVKVYGTFTKNEDASQLNVLFTGSATTVHPLQIDANAISVRVPSDAQNGPVKVTRTSYGTGKTNNDLTILSPLAALQSGKWTQRPDFPTTGKVGATVFTIGTKAFICLGTTNAPFDDYGSSDVWEWDHAYGSWMQKASYPGAGLAFAASFAVNNKGYIGTGLKKSGTVFVGNNDFWQYDPEANTWTKKADFPGSARGEAVGFAAASKGYIGTGDNQADLYEYNPGTNAWTQKASMSKGRNSAYVFVVDDKAYIGNGYNATSSFISDLNMYDPATNQWTAKADIPSFGYYRCASFVLSGKGYVATGQGGGATTAKAFEYTPSTNSWKSIPDYGGGNMFGAVGFAINDAGYVMMGSTFSNLVAVKTSWAYKQ